jgi:hypothetical protein
VTAIYFKTALTVKEFKMLYAFIMTLGLMIVGCGGSETIVEKPVPQQPTNPPDPGGNPNPGGGAVTFSGTIKPLNDKFCALSGCHAGAAFLQTEASFLNSRSKIRVGNGTMPPQYSPNYGQWTQNEKAIYADYFDSN